MKSYLYRAQRCWPLTNTIRTRKTSRLRSSAIRHAERPGWPCSGSRDLTHHRTRITMIDKKNWKSTILVTSISTLGLLLVCFSLIATVRLPFLTREGLLSWLVLLILTLAASRFTISISSTVGSNQSRKSVADAFVFLAVILYAVHPADTVGPATLLAAVVGFVSTYGLSSRNECIATTAIAVISTFVSASCYGFLATVFANDLLQGAGHGLPLKGILVPLCVLAVLQYSLSTLATVYFLNIVEGKP